MRRTVYEWQKRIDALRISGQLLACELRVAELRKRYAVFGEGHRIVGNVSDGSGGKGGGGVDKSGESGIIKENVLTKLKSDGSIVNPTDTEKYQIIRKKLEARGCSVISAKGDDERFLKAFGAEAISDEVGILHLGEIPSASAFFEEIIHYSQIKKYGKMNETDFVERAAREVAANRKLIKNGKSYGFTKEDFEDIRNNLAVWEKDFERRAGMSYDESNVHREI